LSKEELVRELKAQGVNRIPALQIVKKSDGAGYGGTSKDVQKVLDDLDLDIQLNDEGVYELEGVDDDAVADVLEELDEDVKELKERNWGDCSQSEQAKIKKAIKLYDDNKKSGKPERNFKVERFERTKMIQQISSEMGKTFNPFKILGMKASEETPELVKSKCRELKLKNHPDKGGDKDKFDLIQKACDVLLKTQTLLKK